MKNLKKLFMVFWYLYTSISYFFLNEKSIFLKKKKLKVAVIKPFFYLDLYTSSSKNLRKIIYSSQYRFGPVGLFLDLKSDFYISNPEINLEMQKKIKERVKNAHHRKLIQIQKNKSIDENKINYKNYDLILTYEGAVSETIIKKYPSIKWGVLLEDHSNKKYKPFCLFKPKLFDFFLNLTQGYTPYSFFKRNHCIDFSYTFGSINFLKNLKIKKVKKIDVVIEIQQPNEVFKQLNKENMITVKACGDLKIRKYIETLSSSKIFFCPVFTTPRWGNSIIEAALCQSLIIGNKYGYWNSLLIHKDLHCTSIEDGKKIIKKVLSDKNIYEHYLLMQNNLLNEINYILPMRQIHNLLK
jgi:hypothetical protein